MAGLGVHFCAGVESSPGMNQVRANHVRRARELLEEITRGGDASLKVQVLVSLAAMTLHARWFDPSRKCLTKACMILNAANLWFIPATGRIPEFTEDVHERAVVLSQIIYFESYLFLAVDGTDSKMATRIEKEFRHELQVRARLLTSHGMD